MAVLKLIDTKNKFSLEIDGKDIPYVSTYQITKTVMDKFSLEIDGKDIPYVSTYQITKTVMGYLHVDIHLSVNDVEELSIETDQAANVSEKAEDIKFCVKKSKK